MYSLTDTPIGYLFQLGRLVRILIVLGIVLFSEAAPDSDDLSADDGKTLINIQLNPPLMGRALCVRLALEDLSDSNISPEKDLQPSEGFPSEVADQEVDSGWE